MHYIMQLNLNLLKKMEMTQVVTSFISSTNVAQITLNITKYHGLNTEFGYKQ
jgi:hypothetical protein